MNCSQAQRIVLSQELIDMIVDQLAGDYSSLKRCSLVSRRWRSRCRYQLFKLVAFIDSLPRQSIEHWSTTFGPSGVPASITRELHFRQVKKLWIHPTTLTPYLTHLARFTNVTTLVFANLIAAAFNAASVSHCFGSFATRVQHLRLYRPMARATSLMQIILLFPAVIDIEIRYPLWSPVDKCEVPVSPPSGGLRFSRSLVLEGFGQRWPQFFTLLSAHSLGPKKTTIVWCEFGTSIPTQLFLDAVSRTTRNLELVGFAKQHLYSNITLQAFSILESLMFRMSRSGICAIEVAQLLDSISSPRLSTLVLDVGSLEGDLEGRSVENGEALEKGFLDDMKVMDPSLCRLATRTLEGVGKRFTLILIGSNPAVSTHSLVEFRKKGNTRVGGTVVRNGKRYRHWTFQPASGCEAGEADKSALSSVKF